MSETLVDPRVSRIKFEREISLYRQFERDYIRRGWWIVRAEFPEVWVTFSKPMQPPIPAAVVFGALIDFSNYDLWPPSVQLVNPFSRIPYRFRELPTRLPRRVPVVSPSPTSQPTSTPGEAVPQQADATPQTQQFMLQDMMAAFLPDDIPFFCLPGVREYHANPAHTGDSWLLHRRTGAGTLHFILEQLHKYGVQPMNLHIQFLFAPSAAEVQA